MTYLCCTKCGTDEFEQVAPAVRDNTVYQRFKCKNCGEVREMDARSSGIVMITNAVWTLTDMLMRRRKCPKCGYEGDQDEF